jgi:hypothetical protein
LYTGIPPLRPLWTKFVEFVPVGTLPVWKSELAALDVVTEKKVALNIVSAEAGTATASIPTETPAATSSLLRRPPAR